MCFSGLRLKFITFFAIAVFASVSFAQAVFISPKTSAESSLQPDVCETPTPTPPKSKYAPKIYDKEDSDSEFDKTSEKSIQTDAKVNVSLCVYEGKVKISGSERNEVRVFIDQGTEIDFKVRQKNRNTNKPILLDVINPNSKSDKACLSGKEIEIDVPKNATIEFGGQESETIFDSIYRVLVETVSGNIFFNNIENGVQARTYEGLIMLENVKGNIDVNNSNGGIIAYNTSPNEVSDSLKARTESGVINLQNIEHTRLETKSISGAIKYSGDIISGGSYGFGTTSGAILLTIPNDTSCKLSAVYGFGTFSSEIPFKTLTEDKTSRLKRSVVQMGKGEADVSITTFSSSIKIKSLKK